MYGMYVHNTTNSTNFHIIARCWFSAKTDNKTNNKLLSYNDVECYRQDLRSIRAYFPNKFFPFTTLWQKIKNFERNYMLVNSIN